MEFLFNSTFYLFSWKIKRIIRKVEIQSVKPKGLLTEDIIKYDSSYTSVEKFSKEEYHKLKNIFFIEVVLCL